MKTLALFTLAVFSLTSAFADDLTGKNEIAVFAGGGVRIYVGQRWGVAPEFRWARYFHSGADLNTVRVTVAAFLQF